MNLGQAISLCYEVKDELEGTRNAAAVVATDCVNAAQRLGEIFGAGIEIGGLQEVIGRLGEIASNAQEVATMINGVQQKIESDVV
jgi:hypothetical protein